MKRAGPDTGSAAGLAGTAGFTDGFVDPPPAVEPPPPVGKGEGSSDFNGGTPAGRGAAVKIVSSAASEHSAGPFTGLHLATTPPGMAATYPVP